MKLAFIDVETGGLNIGRDPVLQISWILRVNNEEYSNNVFITANPKDCDPVALEVTGIDPESEQAIQEEYAVRLLIQDLKKFIDPDNPKDRFYFVGFNCQTFDSAFIRRLFVKYYYRYSDYFWDPTIDTMLLAAGCCLGQRQKLGDFKLVTVAKSLGLTVDEDMLHDSLYDVMLTKDIFDILATQLLA